MATRTTTSTGRQTKWGSRKLSCSDRKFKQLSIHKRENFEEVGSIGDWLGSHGWEKYDAANHCAGRSSKSQVVTDSDPGHAVEILVPSPTTRPEQIHRNFKCARSVQVVMEVYEKSGEESIAWEDQEMLPDDQNRYRAVAARLNFLAVDRADLLHAAKE